MKKLILFNITFFFLGVNLYAQPIDPLSLHFKKDYQVRNFYNSSVLLSNLDLSQDVFDESIHPKIHLTSPGCIFKQDGLVLQIFNNSAKVQESYIDLGKLYNYIAIDVDIMEQDNSSSMASAQLSFYKDKDNRFVITQRDIDAEEKKYLLKL